MGTRSTTLTASRAFAPACSPESSTRGGPWRVTPCTRPTSTSRRAGSEATPPRPRTASRSSTTSGPSSPGGNPTGNGSTGGAWCFAPGGPGTASFAWHEPRRGPSATFASSTSASFPEAPWAPSIRCGARTPPRSGAGFSGRCTTGSRTGSGTRCPDRLATRCGATARGPWWNGTSAGSEGPPTGRGRIHGPVESERVLSDPSPVDRRDPHTR
jgi:hypothetical protein